MSTRPTDWPQRLSVFVAAKEREPFAWQSNDCALGYAAGWIRALGYDDPATKFRGAYMTSLGAARIIKAHGDLLSIVEQVMNERGWSGVSVMRAQRGDIVATKTPHGPALGVCVGADSIFPGKNGSEKLPTLECVRAWRIS